MFRDCVFRMYLAVAHNGEIVRPIGPARVSASFVGGGYLRVAQGNETKGLNGRILPDTGREVIYYT